MAETSQTPAELKWHQQALLVILALLMRIWGWTLRFHFKDDVKNVIEGRYPPSVFILWHNRLFAAPIFYNRYLGDRQLATLISASGDGAWLAAFLRKLEMHPIRGSRSKRATQSVREMIAVQKEGFDVGVTPDGSRGPMYDMKAGAVAVSMKTGAPIILLSLNFNGAWRLKSWDRFFIPYPFSRIEVRMDAVGQCSDLSEDSKEAAAILKGRLDAITADK